jgi:lycopene beta-cyclase
MPPAECSLLIIGAGLAAAIIAQRVVEESPTVRVTIAEASASPFGEHTWSFHLNDVEPDDLRWMAPLIAHRWAGQEVRFKAYSRSLTSGYASLTSRSVLQHIRSMPAVHIVPEANVVAIDQGGATLADGTRLTADCVIDARGFQPHPAMVLGHQKFVGVEIETNRPHGVTLPIIMDATVHQTDGYRFVYVLPFTANRLLIEDTRYSDGAGLDDEALKAAILSYAETHGWGEHGIVRTERGVLPICLAYDAGCYWSEQRPDIALAGMRAALFHPTTGYSLPEAVRLANMVASHWPLDSAALAPLVKAHALNRARQQGFYRLLNRMLFRAAEPARRHIVLQRFYRLPQPLIERFYAGRTTAWDIVRILVGKPPVPVNRALACLMERSLLNPKAAS